MSTPSADSGEWLRGCKWEGRVESTVGLSSHEGGGSAGLRQGGEEMATVRVEVG